MNAERQDLPFLLALQQEDQPSPGTSTQERATLEGADEIPEATRYFVHKSPESMEVRMR